MPLRSFLCPKCGAVIEKSQGLKVERTHECECGFHGEMKVHIKGSKVGVQTEKDWTHGKTDDEIAEYLVPDENGEFKNPY